MKSKPILIMTLDTETYGLVGGLKRIAVYDGKTVVYGYTYKDIEPTLIDLSKKYNIYIYIHNLEFDLRKIAPELIPENIIDWSSSFIINNRIAKVKTKYYTLMDSGALLPVSLSQLSKDFDVEHGKIDLWEKVEELYGNMYKDLGDYFERCDKDDPLYLEYLGYDVMSLHEVVYKIIDITGIPINKFVKIVTMASLSRYLFKNGHKGHIFKNPENNKTDYEILTSFDWTGRDEYEQFLRDSYCGGRVEVFNMLLGTKGKHYDENSAYPYEMLFDVPVGAYKFYKDALNSERVFNKWLDDKIGLGFLYCDVFIPYQNVPPLPLKMGKLCFPCGHVFGVFAYEELEFAIKHCGVQITAYHECMHFNRTYPVFKNFIDYFYSEKARASREGKKAERTLYKYVQNTGYGYTGMKRDNKTALDSISNYYNYDSKDILNINTYFGYIEVRQEIKSKYIQVQVASTITSRARVLLLKPLKYSDKNGELYYCDTDSIVTDVTMPEEWVDDYRLGALKLESEPDKGIFLAPKVYAELLEDESGNGTYKDSDGKNYKVFKKFKGVTKDTQAKMRFDDYLSLFKDMQSGIKKSEKIESGRIVLRSIKYMQDKNLPYDYYEIRDKYMYFDKPGKRVVDYNTGKTYPYFFESIDDFMTFSFSRAGNVEIGG